MIHSRWNCFLFIFFLASENVFFYGGFSRKGEIVEDFISSETGMKLEVCLHCPAYLHSDKRAEQLRLLFIQMSS